jgi:hypothetical protein
MSDKLKYIKEALLCVAESQISHLEDVDAEELGEVIDMIKDLEEAEYYCAVVKAMEESEKYEHEGMMYYPPMYYGGKGDHSNWKEKNMMSWRDEPRYYGGDRGGHSTSNSGDSNNNTSYYSEKEMGHVFEDPREGKSYRARRMYIEAKETHQDKTA